jgi:hypothetical protein
MPDNENIIALVETATALVSRAATLVDSNALLRTQPATAGPGGDGVVLVDDGTGTVREAVTQARLVAVARALGDTGGGGDAPPVWPVVANIAVQQSGSAVAVGTIAASGAGSYTLVSVATGLSLRISGATVDLAASAAIAPADINRLTVRATSTGPLQFILLARSPGNATANLTVTVISTPMALPSNIRCADPAFVAASPENTLIGVLLADGSAPISFSLDDSAGNKVKIIGGQTLAVGAVASTAGTVTCVVRATNAAGSINAALNISVTSTTTGPTPPAGTDTETLGGSTTFSDGGTAAQVSGVATAGALGPNVSAAGVPVLFNGLQGADIFGYDGGVGIYGTPASMTFDFDAGSAKAFGGAEVWVPTGFAQDRPGILFQIFNVDGAPVKIAELDLFAANQPGNYVYTVPVVGTPGNVRRYRVIWQKNSTDATYAKTLTEVKLKETVGSGPSGVKQFSAVARDALSAYCVWQAKGASAGLVEIGLFDSANAAEPVAVLKTGLTGNNTIVSLNDLTASYWLAARCALGGLYSAWSAKSAVTAPPTFIVDDTPSNQTVAYRVVVEDWATGVGVDVAGFSLGRKIRDGRWAEAAYRSNLCSGWTDYGVNSTTFVEYKGIRFTGKRRHYAQDGLFAAAPSGSLCIFMQATDLEHGLWGDPTNKRTYLDSFKLRIESSNGTLLGRIQMRDGLAINDPSTKPRWMDDELASSTYVRRGHMPAGSMFVWQYGVTNQDAPAAVVNRLARVKSDYPEIAAMLTYSYNGSETDIGSGNGHQHIEVIPQWAMSKAAAAAVTSTAVAGGNSLLINPTHQDWKRGMLSGWDYEPGNLGMINGRGGPGGKRVERHVTVGEACTRWLGGIYGGVRRQDNTPYKNIAYATLKNIWNYATYRLRSPLNCDPVNVFTNKGWPSATGAAATGEYRVPQLVRRYYGNVYVDDFAYYKSGLWVGDAYGDPSGPGGGYFAVYKNPLDNRLPNGGWAPDSEHANRQHGRLAVLLRGDPLGTLVQEFLLAELGMQTNFIDGTGIEGSTSDGRVFGRSDFMRLIHLIWQWDIADEYSQFSRTVCYAQTVRMLKAWYQLKYANASGSATTSSLRGVYHYGLPVLWDATVGWFIYYGVEMSLLAPVLAEAKASGLYAALRADADTQVQGALDGMEKALRTVQELAVSMPWACPADPNGSIRWRLRTPAQGAVQSDLTTIPTTISAAAANNPAPRGDAYYWLDSSGGDVTGGASYTYDCLLQTAECYAEYFMANGAARTAALSTLAARRAAWPARANEGSTPVDRSGKIVRSFPAMYWPFSIPALSV